MELTNSILVTPGRSPHTIHRFELYLALSGLEKHEPCIGPICPTWVPNRERVWRLDLLFRSSSNIEIGLIDHVAKWRMIHKARKQGFVADLTSLDSITWLVGFDPGDSYTRLNRHAPSFAPGQRIRGFFNKQQRLGSLGVLARSARDEARSHVLKWGHYLRLPAVFVSGPGPVSLEAEQDQSRVCWSGRNGAMSRLQDGKDAGSWILGAHLV